MKLFVRLLILAYLVLGGIGGYKVGGTWFCILSVLIGLITVSYPRFGTLMAGALLGWIVGAVVGAILTILYPFNEAGLVLVILLMTFSLSTIETIPAVLSYACCVAGAVLGAIIGWDLGSCFDRS